MTLPAPPPASGGSCKIMKHITEISIWNRVSNIKRQIRCRETHHARDDERMHLMQGVHMVCQNCSAGGTLKKKHTCEALSTKTYPLSLACAKFTVYFGDGPGLQAASQNLVELLAARRDSLDRLAPLKLFQSGAANQTTNFFRKMECRGRTNDEKNLSMKIPGSCAASLLKGTSS
jgi:hypothetical protein